MGKPRGAWADKAFRDALRRVVLQRDVLTRKRKLDLLAHRLVNNAMDGDTHALGMVADRLDGKASQPIEHSGSVDVAMTLDRIIAQRREREMSMRNVSQMLDAPRAN